MALYLVSLFLHIVGALGLFAALGLEWASLYNLRRVSVAGQVREWAKLLGAPRFVGGPAALILLVTGGYLSATRWGRQGWIIVGLAGMVVIALLGAALSGRRVGAIARALPPEDGPISTLLRQRLRDPVLTLSVAVRTALALGIVFVMASKPSAAGALVDLGVALVLGLVATLPAWSGAGSQGDMGSHPTAS